MSTITEAITKDHREIEEYYNEVVHSSDLEHQERFGNQFTWELARHSVAEELIVYPAFEKYLGDEGKVMAEKDRKEHHEVSWSQLIHPENSILTKAGQSASQKLPKHECNGRKLRPKT
jgi:hypothetical protein